MWRGGILEREAAVSACPSHEATCHAGRPDRFSAWNRHLKLVFNPILQRSQTGKVPRDELDIAFTSTAQQLVR